jgi:hypothetical protein
VGDEDVQLTLELTIAGEDLEKPVCVAEVIYRCLREALGGGWKWIARTPVIGGM